MAPPTGRFWTVVRSQSTQTRGFEPPICRQCCAHLQSRFKHVRLKSSLKWAGEVDGCVCPCVFAWGGGSATASLILFRIFLTVSAKCLIQPRHHRHPASAPPARLGTSARIPSFVFTQHHSKACQLFTHAHTHTHMLAPAAGGHKYAACFLGYL